MDRITREQLDLWARLSANATAGSARDELMAFAVRHSQQHIDLLTYWKGLLQRRLRDVGERISVTEQDSFNIVITRLQTDIHSLELRKFSLTAMLKPGWLSASGVLTQQAMRDLRGVEAEVLDLIKQLDFHVDLP